MKILFISATYPSPQLPSLGTFNRTMVQGLRERHEVKVIAPIPWTYFCRASVSDSAIHPIYFYPPKILRSQYHLFFAYSVHGAVRSVRRDFTPDIVLSNWLHPDGAASIRIARQMGVPAVVIAGGSDLRLLSKKATRRKAITNACLNADRIIVVNQELTTHAYQLGMSPDRMDVISRGIDGTVFKPIDKREAREQSGIDPSARVVFWAGRLEQVKQPHLLLHAARIWQERYGKKLQVLIAGEGALRKSLETVRRQLGLTQTVTLLGSVEQTQLALLYNAADVIALTSSSEGTPNVLLEAISCGARFVASDVGGVSAISTPGIDRLVPAGDCEAFSDAVIASLEQPSQCTTALANRRFIPYDHRAMCHATEASLQLAVQQPMVPFKNHFQAQRIAEVLP